MNYKITKNIPIVFHNLSSYDSHLIINKIANEFVGEFECLGENTEKYISFSVKINKKITKKDEAGNENQLHYQIMLIIFQMGYIIINA